MVEPLLIIGYQVRDAKHYCSANNLRMHLATTVQRPSAIVERLMGRKGGYVIALTYLPPFLETEIKSRDIEIQYISA